MAEIERRQIEDRAEWLEWRTEDVTASVGACLFGDDVHEYTSAYQQWAFHSGLWKPRPLDAKLARRGFFVEKGAADVICEERPDWDVAPNEDYYRDAEARIGATPDFIARRPDIEGMGNIQVKSIGEYAFRKWRNRDTGETALPVWIGIQANIEAALMRASWAAVVAITIGNQGLDVEIIDVPLVPSLYPKFKLLVEDFWRRVREREPYDVNWGKDAAAILQMYADDDGATIDLTGDEEFSLLLTEREDLKSIEEAGAHAEKARKLRDAKIIHRMGNARAARINGGFVQAKTVKVKEAPRRAYSFRRITVRGHEHSRPDSDSAE